MVLGNLIDLKNHINKPEVDLINAFITKVKSDEVPIGEWIFLNEELKVLVLIKSGYTEGVFESHTIYKDLHIVVEGIDTIFLGNKNSAIVKTDYDEIGDYTLFNSKMLSSIKMTENTFALIDKGEIHTNHIDGESTKKIVVKLKK